VAKVSGSCILTTERSGLGERSPSLFFMTIEYGLGMLAIGIIAILIGAVVAFFIINKVMEGRDK